MHDLIYAWPAAALIKFTSSSDVLSGLYPGYTGQFSYEALGQHPTSLYDTSSMGKGLSNYGGIYVPSAAAASATALPSKCFIVILI